jgi:cytosine/adenosine deaminase-related metal-dependent hydrolase
MPVPKPEPAGTATAGARTLLARHADVLVTMDEARREIRDGALYIRGHRIEQVGATNELPAEADDIIELAGHVVLPGLVNTHHHMFQSLTRAVPAAQDSELFGWLQALYPIWARLTPEAIRVSALTAMAELILSGCTTSSDHLYVFPGGCRLDDTIDAASEIGLRFHALRGAMSLGKSRGGLPPDALVEDEEAVLADARRVIEAHHDAARYAMVRVGVAPCSPFSVTDDLMREAAALARFYGVGLHTHLAESVNDVAYSRERYGRTPAEYAEALGWTGRDVWHAHCVQLDAPGIALFARTGTGVAHCPCSNMRLGSGIAPVRRMRDAGVPVALGVDGSASNDGGQMLAEARQALLLARLAGDPGALTARDVLEMATRGGAAVLGRDDIGILAPGMAADFAAFDVSGLLHAGALHDPVAALVFCGAANVRHSVINGRIVVQDGRLVTLDLGPHIERHNRLARQLVVA